VSLPATTAKPTYKNHHANWGKGGRSIQTLVLREKDHLSGSDLYVMQYNMLPGSGAHVDDVKHYSRLFVDTLCNIMQSQIYDVYIPKFVKASRQGTSSNFYIDSS
jgi:hypothetical protein